MSSDMVRVKLSTGEVLEFDANAELTDEEAAWILEALGQELTDEDQTDAGPAA